MKECSYAYGPKQPRDHNGLLHAVDVHESGNAERQRPPVEKVKPGKAKKHKKPVAEQELTPVGITARADTQSGPAMQTVGHNPPQTPPIIPVGDRPSNLSTSRANGNLNPRAPPFR